MKVIVYVEGPSDVAAMNALLEPLIDQKMKQGIQITFNSIDQGDAKKAVLIKVPERAATIILNDPDAYVVAMPDLYPHNKAFPHETDEQLCDGIYAKFVQQLENKGNKDSRNQARFKVFCFKYDLEALILAAEESLADRLSMKSLEPSWTIPVENQNHNQPPKHIVQELFKEHDKKYVETIDAPLILSDMDYRKIAERCPQQFAKFVDFLENPI